MLSPANTTCPRAARHARTSGRRSSMRARKSHPATCSCSACASTTGPPDVRLDPGAEEDRDQENRDPKTGNRKTGSRMLENQYREQKNKEQENREQEDREQDVREPEQKTG